jgi:hypothetical protein
MTTGHPGSCVSSVASPSVIGNITHDGDTTRTYSGQRLISSTTIIIESAFPSRPPIEFVAAEPVVEGEAVELEAGL